MLPAFHQLTYTLPQTIFCYMTNSFKVFHILLAFFFHCQLFYSKDFDSLGKLIN